MISWYIAAFLGIATIFLTRYITKASEKMQRTIEAQQDTINKLINREPVTYKEVGREKPKLDTDRPVAWGGTIMDRDDL